MKNLVMIAILMLVVFIIACETEDPIDEKGATVISSSAEGHSPEEQPDKRLNFMDRVAQDFTTKHGCFVGETIILKATVLAKEWDGGAIILETNNDLLWFRVDLRPLHPVAKCEDYYKEGETYVFPLLIIAIWADTGREIQDWREGNIKDVRFFDIYSEIVITEELEEELQEADCWKEER